MLRLVIGGASRHGAVARIEQTVENTEMDVSLISASESESVLFPFPISQRSKIQDQHTLVWRARHFKQAASESESENGVSLQISGCMCQVRYWWRTPRQTAHSSQPQRARVRVKFPCKYLIACARCGADDCRQFRDNYQLFLSICGIFKNNNPTFLGNCQCM